MKARSTLKPNQRGAKKFSKQYGDRLVYVRYRYDPVQKKRFTTVELIVDEADWTPRNMPSPDQIVGIQVEVQERDVQKRMKQAGGRWNAQRKVWELRYDKVVAEGWQARMVTDMQ